MSNHEFQAPRTVHAKAHHRRCQRPAERRPEHCRLGRRIDHGQRREPTRNGGQQYRALADPYRPTRDECAGCGHAATIDCGHAANRIIGDVASCSIASYGVANYGIANYGSGHQHCRHRRSATDRTDQG